MRIWLFIWFILCFSHKIPVCFTGAWINPFALEMDVYSLAHHLCTM